MTASSNSWLPARSTQPASSSGGQKRKLEMADIQHYTKEDLLKMCNFFKERCEISEESCKINVAGRQMVMAQRHIWMKMCEASNNPPSFQALREQDEKDWQEFSAWQEKFAALRKNVYS